MIKGVDTGGWKKVFGDVAGAVKNVRFSSAYATEEKIGNAAAAGVSLATVIFGEGGTIGAIDPTVYANSIVAHFKKYGKGGTFWQGKTDLGGRVVEVLNEPGGSWFWKDPTNYAAYVKLLKAVHGAMAANFPEAIRPKVIASWDGGASSTSFGRGWKALGGLSYCDGVSVHPYGGSTGQHGGALGDRKLVEAAHVESGKPVYVTEVGWPTAVGKPSTGDSQQWDEAQQAFNITDFVKWARSTSYVAMTVLFNFIDYGTNSYYGVERADRSHKPSYTALAAA